MADSFGLKIGLEGEKEFKKALADINQSFKVLGSEMKLATSQFDKTINPWRLSPHGIRCCEKRSMSRLQNRHPSQGSAECRHLFGENDRRTQNWQIQLNNAEAALNDMNRELDEMRKPSRMAARLRRNPAASLKASARFSKP